MKHTKIYRPSITEAIKAFCCECLNNYADRRRDCENIKCPLYSRHQFRKKAPDLNWVFDNWSKKHQNKIERLKISKAEYITNFVWNNNKSKVGTRDPLRAKCYYCMNGYLQVGEAGRIDCEITNCPIYFWMPYRKKEVCYNWMFDSTYTKKHERNRIILNVSRKEYIQILINKRLENKMKSTKEGNNEQL
jgi:hypothetical protein